MPIQENNSEEKKLKVQCEEINADWLVNTDVKAYPVCHDGEYGINWKIKLVETNHPEPITIMDHIDPNGIGNGHVLYLTMRAIQSARELGIKEGKERAHGAISKLLLKTIKEY